MGMGGMHKRTSYNEGNRQTIQVEKIYEHNFPGGTMFMTKDIALLKLSKPFVLDDYVQTIPMAEAGEDFTGQTCVLTGWGLPFYFQMFLILTLQLLYWQPFSLRGLLLQMKLRQF